MTALRFIAMDSETARAYREGKADANGQPPEHHISDGGGNPCRHCLMDIAEGEPFLAFAYRPFPEPQPYAEVGPVFLHAEACLRYHETAGAPAMFLERDTVMVRGYGADHRIKDGTGQVTPSTGLEQAAAAMLEDSGVAYAHVRSATNNCYQCRIERD